MVSGYNILNNKKKKGVGGVNTNHSRLHLALPTYGGHTEAECESLSFTIRRPSTPVTPCPIESIYTDINKTWLLLGRV